MELRRIDEMLLDCADGWLTPAEISQINGLGQRVVSQWLRVAVQEGRAWRRNRPGVGWEYRAKPETVDRLRQIMSSKIRPLSIKPRRRKTHAKAV